MRISIKQLAAVALMALPFSHAGTADQLPARASPSTRAAQSGYANVNGLRMYYEV